MKYKYEIIYPKNEITKETPVALTLHGMGSSYLDLRPLIPVFGREVIELHLQGDLDYGGGYTYFIPEFTKKTEQEIIGTVVKDIHDEVVSILETEKLEKNPLFSLGFSQGAILNIGLGIFYPNWLDTVVILSGRLPEFYVEEAKKNLVDKKVKTNFFISQGKKDPLFAPTVGQKIAKFLGEYSDNVAYHEYSSGHTVDRQAPRDIYDWIMAQV